ncbi:polysaccharide lyase family 7 protein, partial [Aquimarina pacifica]
LDVRVRAVHLPVEKPEVSMVQIHGPDDEPLRVEYRADDQGLHVVQNEDSTAEYVLPYSLGQQLRVTVIVNNGNITCEIINEDTGDSWDDTWEAEDSTGYFKVGCYTQSTMFLEDCKSGEGYSNESPSAYGLVAVKDLSL